MSDTAKKADAKDTGAAKKPAAGTPTDSKSPEGKPAQKKRSSHVWVLLLMLLVLAGMVAVMYWYGIVQPGRFGLLQHAKPTAPAIVSEHPAAPATGAPAPKAAPIPPPRPAIPEAQTKLSSQDAQQLMAAMKQLQGQLQQLHDDNEQLRQALDKQQHTELRSRLKLIADPSTRLAQLALLWEDVSLSPVISAKQRNEAISMTAAAREALSQNQRWQQRLDQLIAKLAEPGSGPDLIPHFDHPWLAWLASQFHLRPAPSNGSKGSQALREKLMQIRRGMTIETWPDAKDWQPIRAELVLIEAGTKTTGAKTPPGLGLPNDFKAIRQAVVALHATARQWPEAKP